MATAGVQAQAPEKGSAQGFWTTESRARTAVLALLLVVVTLALYSPVRNFTFFSLDDHFYVLDNEHVHDGLNWKTVTWAFTCFDRANWIPLSFLSHALDYQLFGDNPSGHHEISVLLHATNAALLFWLLATATGYGGRSFMVAALFALHPLNVEGVAWIAERKTVLSMLFFLLTLAAYRWYAAQPKESRYWTAVGLFAVGLTAKAQIITLPCVLLLWDFWPLQRTSLGQPPSPEAKLPPLPQKPVRFLLMEKVPFLLVAAFAALLTIHSEGVARARLWPPLSQRLANAAYSYCEYLVKAFWPSSMAPMYPNLGASLARWQAGAAALVLLAITALVVAGRRHRYLPVGWFWFLGTLVPMIQVFQFGVEGMADRFAYQALIGIFLIVCWGCSDLAQARRASTAWLAASGAIVLAALSCVTVRQISYWKDPATMWTHAIAVVPNHWVAQEEMGKELTREGKPDEALTYFRRATAINPNTAASNISLALDDQQHGHWKDAVDHYQNALRDYSLGPHDIAAIYANMAIAYRNLGEAAKADECLEKASQWHNP